MAESKLKKSSICKWGKKGVGENMETLVTLVNKPKYLCKNCGRSANNKKNLCEPVSFKKITGG